MTIKRHLLKVKRPSERWKRSANGGRANELLKETSESATSAKAAPWELLGQIMTYKRASSQCFSGCTLKVKRSHDLAHIYIYYI